MEQGRTNVGLFWKGLFDARASGECVGTNLERFLILLRALGRIFALQKGLLDVSARVCGGEGAATFQRTAGGAAG